MFMAGLALSAVKGLVPGIATYAVLRGSYYLFVERTQKVEILFEIFKANVAGSVNEWNRRHCFTKDQISFADALWGTGALQPTEMKKRDCCQNIKKVSDAFSSQDAKGELSDLSCLDLRKKMKTISGEYCTPLKPAAWSIVAGSVGAAALSLFLVPDQVKSSSLFSRVLYRGVSSIGCLVAGFKMMKHFNNHIVDREVCVEK